MTRHFYNAGHTQASHLITDARQHYHQSKLISRGVFVDSSLRKGSFFELYPITPHHLPPTYHQAIIHLYNLPSPSITVSFPSSTFQSNHSNTTLLFAPQPPKPNQSYTQCLLVVKVVNPVPRPSPRPDLPRPVFNVSRLFYLPPHYPLPFSAFALHHHPSSHFYNSC